MRWLDFTDEQVAQSIEVQTLLLQITKSKKVVFVTGAGISCSAGIPDFASADGLYNDSKLISSISNAYPELGKLKMKDVFSANIFQTEQGSSCFRQVMGELYQLGRNCKATTTHRLMGHFSRLGRLTRSYTQNIDGLEDQVVHLTMQYPGPGECSKSIQGNVIPLHGSLKHLKCALCSWSGGWQESWIKEMAQGHAVPCPSCSERDRYRVGRGQRQIAIGLLRPDILLYDEMNHLTSEMTAKAQTIDLKKLPDLVLVMGTSLKIPAVRRLIAQFAKSAKMVIYINKTAPPAEMHAHFGLWIQAPCDTFSEQLMLTWQERRAQDWSRQSTLALVKQPRLIAVAGSKLKMKQSKKAEKENQENHLSSAIVKCVKQQSSPRVVLAPIG